MRLLAGTAIAFTSLVCFAQIPDKGPKQPNEQWVSLFNGKDLSGWAEVGHEKWEVVDGVIHGQGITQDYGYLRTNGRYKDFHMSVRFKCVGDGNSGVFFHTEFEGATAKVTQGLQFEIDPTIAHHTGGIYGDKRKWIVWPSPENEFVVHSDDWNDYLLKVEGNHYVARLNGVTMVDFTDPTPKSTDGYIALQLHSGGHGNMQFKEIFLRDLTVR